MFFGDTEKKRKKNESTCLTISWKSILNEASWDIIDDLSDSPLIASDTKVMMRENRRVKVICNKENTFNISREGSKTLEHEQDSHEPDNLWCHFLHLIELHYLLKHSIYPSHLSNLQRTNLLEAWKWNRKCP